MHVYLAHNNGKVRTCCQEVHMSSCSSLLLWRRLRCSMVCRLPRLPLVMMIVCRPCEIVRRPGMYFNGPQKMSVNYLGMLAGTIGEIVAICAMETCICVRAYMYVNLCFSIETNPSNPIISPSSSHKCYVSLRVTTVNVYIGYLCVSGVVQVCIH